MGCLGEPGGGVLAAIAARGGSLEGEVAWRFGPSWAGNIKYIEEVLPVQGGKSSKERWKSLGQGVQSEKSIDDQM